jgi:hypothetical protein
MAGTVISMSLELQLPRSETHLAQRWVPGCYFTQGEITKVYWCYTFN